MAPAAWPCLNSGFRPRVYHYHTGFQRGGGGQAGYVGNAWGEGGRTGLV